MESDQAYFARRAREERRAAQNAGSAGARTAHLELAARYHDLASALAKHRELIGS